MDAQACLNKLRYVGVLSFATVDGKGNPQVRNISAIHYEPEGYLKCITDEIKKAIGDEKDPYKASCRNVRHSVQEIEKSLCIHHMEEETGLRVVGAMYHIEDGSVEFL